MNEIKYHKQAFILGSMALENMPLANINLSSRFFEKYFSEEHKSFWSYPKVQALIGEQLLSSS